MGVASGALAPPAGPPVARGNMNKAGYHDSEHLLCAPRQCFTYIVKLTLSTKRAHSLASSHFTDRETETDEVTSTDDPVKGSRADVSACTPPSCPTKSPPQLWQVGAPLTASCPQTTEQEQLPATRGPQAVGGLVHCPTPGRIYILICEAPIGILSTHQCSRPGESALKSSHHPGILSNFL